MQVAAMHVAMQAGTILRSFVLPCSNLGQTHFWYHWDEAEELMIQTGSSNMYIDTAVVAAKITVILYVLAEDECLC